MNKKIDYELILNSYANGIFPMAKSRYDKNISFYKPLRRGIIPLNKVKVSKSLIRLIKKKTTQLQLTNALKK